MILHACAQCGEAFEGRSSARFCSEKCRQRSARGKPAQTPAVVTQDATAEGVGPVTEATVRELAAVGRSLTARGLAVVALARQVDAGRDSGAAMAALVRQHGQTLTEALEDAAGAWDIVDELRDELAQRRAGQR